MFPSAIGFQNYGFFFKIEDKTKIIISTLPFLAWYKAKNFK